MTYNSAYNQTVIHKILGQTPFRFQLVETNRRIKPVDAKPPQKESKQSEAFLQLLTTTSSLCIDHSLPHV